MMYPSGIVFSWDSGTLRAPGTAYTGSENYVLPSLSVPRVDPQNVKNPDVLSPYAMSPSVMSPDIMGPDVMSPNVLSLNRAGFTLQEPAPGMSSAGFSETGRSPSQLGAMLRSFVMPGWGHYYVNPDSWRRGQFHLGAEVVLIASYLGISRQSYVLEKNMYTHATAFSGADIQALGREFELAVGNYRSLSEYNDFQERTRNLDRIFPDEPQYRWEWESDALRREYLDLRNRRDDLDNQLPALAALMVVNRVISGISAYSRAGAFAAGQASVHVAPGPAGNGFRTVVSIPF